MSSFAVVTESVIRRSQLDSYFISAGLPTDYFLTSLVTEELPRGVKLEAEDIKAQLPRLQAELKPHKLIMVLGATALKAVTKKTKITQMIGQIIEQDGTQVIPNYAPNYILRDPSKEPEFLSALLRFKQVLRGGFQQKTELVYQVIARHNLEQFQKDFSECDEFVYDLETSGLDWYASDSYINCVGLYLGTGKAYVLPIRKAPTLPEDAQRKLLKWMEAQGKRAIGHNVKFDSLWLRKKFDVHFVTHFDTMLAHHLLDENSPHGLKELSRRFLNAPDYDLTTAEKKGDTLAEKLFKYCAWDCYYTYELKKLFVKDLFKDIALRKLYYKMIVPAARMMETVDGVGHYIDLPRMEQTRTELQVKLSVAEAKLNEIAGKEVNWNSPKQVAVILFTDLGLVPKVFTDKGLPSTGEAALAELDAHPIKSLLMEYRGHQKQLSTYIDGWGEYMVAERLYLSTKIHGTVTGRWSSRLHQVPRDGTIRNLFTAPPGWTFVQADLSQAEVRVAGMMSRDPELIYCYSNDIDVHWRTAMGNLALQGSGPLADKARKTVELHGGDSNSPWSTIIDALLEMGPERAVELDKGWKEIRKQAKSVVFGYIFGMSAKKFTEYAKVQYGWDVSLPEAENIREAFFSTYSQFRPWHERQRQLVRLDGSVRNLFGRLRRLPGIWSSDREVKAEAERLAVNAPVQGTIGDYKVVAMLAVFDQFPRGEVQVLGEVHDSVLMWVRSDLIQTCLPMIKYQMENPPVAKELGVEFSIPLKVDIEVGRWGDGKTWRLS